MRAAGFGLALLASTSALAAPPPPPLVVLTVVDQLATSTFLRHEARLRGIGALAKAGALYPNGVHDYANTATGPGHATIYTGAPPSAHGIVNNEWHESGTGRLVYCAEALGGASPANLVAPTIADQLRLHFGPEAKVVALSGKDRAAVLAAHRPTHAIWYDDAARAFVRGAFSARPEAPAWLAAVNARHSPALAFGKTWDRFAALDYAAVAGPDDRPEEADIAGLGRTFPHVYGRGLDGPGHADWGWAYAGTPDALDALFLLAERALIEERLGQGGPPDLLVLAISSLDLVGHWYGPSSQEAFDVLLRIDAHLAAFRAKVEATIGGGQTIWIVTADHGIALEPERTQAEIGIGRRFVRTEVEAELNAQLRAAKLPELAKFDPPLVHLRQSETAPLLPDAARRAAAIFARHPSILRAVPASDAKELGPMFERMMFPGRSADVLVLTPPMSLVSYATGSSHGSPYTHDTNVPMLMTGPGLAAARDPAPTSVTRIAPTIAALLSMPPPSAAHDPPLAALAHR